MKKVLVLNGSPKKENSTTMLVTNNFLKGLESTGEYKSEIINVSSLNVKPCKGCLSCWGRTNGNCVIKGDDVQMVKDKFLEAFRFSFSVCRENSKSCSTGCSACSTATKVFLFQKKDLSTGSASTRARRSSS